MQDPPLSRLSRGCGRLVSSNGRLDVCFTPQDYYIWRDQDSLLRLSNSLMGKESTLPKTFSTRRGALLLYSQHLVSMESSRCLGNRNRKQRAAQRSCQQVEQQLSTLRNLTEAVLKHSNNQFFSSRPPVLPPLNLPAASRTLNTKHQQLSPERNTKQPENQSEDTNGQLGTRRRVRLDLYLQIPRTSRTSRTPTPQTEPHPWVQPVALTPEEPERPQININIKHHGTGEFHDPNINNIGLQAADGGCRDDRGSCGSRCGRTVRLTAEQPSNSEPEPNSTSGLVLPPLNAGSCRQNSVMSLWEVFGVGGRPPTEVQTVRSGCQDKQPQAGGTEIHLQENPKRCSQQPHFLPLLFPGRDDLSGDKRREENVKPERRRVKTEAAERRRGPWSSSDGGSVVLLQPGEDPRLPAGPSGSVSLRRGPGRQSTLAFLQNLQNLCGPSDTNRDVVKGVLPLQLRNVQSGRSVGCLILGPDGEIIRLSLFDNNQDQTEALQVVSADGQEFPWFVLLQPQHTLTEAEEELNTDDPGGDIQQHQSVHQQLLDILRSLEMDSTSSCTDSGTNSAAASVRNKSHLNPGEKDNSSNEMNLLMEERGGNTEEEEDDKEEQSSSGHSRHLPASPGSGRIMNISEAAAEEEEEESMGRTKKTKNPENTVVTTGKNNVKMVKIAESDKQKTMRKEKRRQKTESDDQSKQEEKTNDDEETLDRSVLPSGKKKMRGDLKMKEEEESAERKKRRMRRREKKTELHVEIPEASLQNEDPKATSDFKSSSATKHKNTKSEELTDLSANHSVTNDPSSVQSAHSLRSVSNQRSLRRSAASSCDWPTAGAGVTSSYGRLSSCSTVMVTEEQLMLNPVKPESSRLRRSQEMKMEEEEMKMKVEETKTKVEVKDAAALHLSQQAERKRQEEERKRKEKEEEERKRREEEQKKRREEEERKQQTEDRMKMELQEERKRRSEELRMKKLEEEEEERRRKMEEEEHRVKREEEQRERERRRQEEKKRKMERLKRMREEEEQRRRAAAERLQLENQKLQEMDEDQRMDYLQKKEEEEEARRRREERRLEEELISRQVALLQQQSAFKQALLLEAGGLQKTQSVSRPWIYSYFTLMQLMGLKS